MGLRVRGEQVQIQITQRQLLDSEEAFREEFQRLLGAEALPIEVINIVDQLGVARQELIKSVTGYNQAQFRLFVATGGTPTQGNLPANEPPRPPAGPSAVAGACRAEAGWGCPATGPAGRLLPHARN